MKKTLFFLAIAGLLSFAACKSGENKADATADSTAAQVETPVDTAAPAVADSVK